MWVLYILLLGYLCLLFLLSVFPYLEHRCGPGWPIWSNSSQPWPGAVQADSGTPDSSRVGYAGPREHSMPATGPTVTGAVSRCLESRPGPNWLVCGYLPVLEILEESNHASSSSNLVNHSLPVALPSQLWSTLGGSMHRVYDPCNAMHNACNAILNHDMSSVCLTWSQLKNRLWYLWNGEAPWNPKLFALWDAPQHHLITHIFASLR